MFYCCNSIDYSLLLLMLYCKSIFADEMNHKNFRAFLSIGDENFITNSMWQIKRPTIAYEKTQ